MFQNHAANVWAIHVYQGRIERLLVWPPPCSKREPPHQQTTPFDWRGLTDCGSAGLERRKSANCHSFERQHRPEYWTPLN
jgi:hypothetical protein